MDNTTPNTLPSPKKLVKTGEIPKSPKGKSSYPSKIPVKALKNPCSPRKLGFKTTDELPDLQTVIGQPRAMRALELGSEVTGPGYNIFVLGLPASGRTTLSQEYLARKAALETVPDDWCYIYNFENPRIPKALRLPVGQGVELKNDLNELITYCEREIPRSFESKVYIEERDRLLAELKRNQEAEFSCLQQHVQKFNFLVAQTPFGVLLVPAPQGKPLSQEEIESLEPEQRKKLEQLQAKLGEEVEKTLKRLKEMENEASKLIVELNTKTILFLIGPKIEALKEKYSLLEQVVAHLEDIKKDILTHNEQFQPHDRNKSGELGLRLDDRSWAKRYEANVLVDNSKTQGAPVIVETHPVYHNLVGRIEHEVIMGASRTDFTMIRPGSLHKANGGYLVIPARDLLINPYAWEGIKRALRDGCIRIVEIGSQLGLLSTETLDPEPIPLKIKIVLVGTPMLYYMLQAHDEDFSKLFKVRAEFGTRMDRTPEAEREYGLFVKSVVLDNGLPPFSNDAVARIIEFSSRLAEDQQKLSTRFGRMADLVREAAYWAKKENTGNKPATLVTAASVERAIEESIYRTNLVDEAIQEMIVQGTIAIEVSGWAIGQINAISVFSLGDYNFGRPNRLTASVSPGRSGIVDIEHQAKLGGAIHTKGVLILSGYLNSRYGRNEPLNLSASITFEQSYSEIEGDSASVAELIVLLSAIAQVPIRQDIAITGSIDQHGKVQAIGGVNEKIEGFFATCKAKGLTGSQGVVIPEANKKSLMLRQEVIDAVSAGMFHIWSIRNVDQGLSIFTGLEAGKLQKDGTYPKGTFNHKLTTALSELTKALESNRNKSVEADNKGINKPKKSKV